MTYEPPAPLPPSRPADELERGPTGWVARLRAAAEIANYVGETDFVPQALRGNAPAIAAAILYGGEIGLDPMTALQLIAVIRGRPTLTAEGQRAQILAAGHEIWLEESTTTRAIVAGRRAGSDRIGRVTWTMDDAKRAGLAGQPAYRAYPREMLIARASAGLARQMFADVVRGLPATEELEGEQDGPPAEPPPAPPDTPPPAPATRTRRRRPAPTPAAGPAPAPEPEPEPARPALPPTPPPDDQPEPEPPAEPESTSAQRRQMFALFRDLGLEERDEQLEVVRQAIGRDVESRAELTLGEAATVIDALKRRKAGDDVSGSEPVRPPPDQQAAPEDAGPPDEPEAPGPVPYNEFPPGY
jgi:hypothetical protein